MLKVLTDLDGVSGNEKAVRDIIFAEVSPFCSEIKTDSMGNLICFKKGRKGGKTVLLSAHMDEVGFIITKITDEGFLKFETVGGVEPKILLSQVVRKGDLKGIISLKAVHLLTKEEREKAFSESELFIDIGAKSKEEAEKVVSLGDYFAFDSEYISQGDMIKAKALDDRVGCTVLIDALKKEWDANLICTFVVQEEVGLRGAKAAVYGLKPDFAIVVEGTTCNDLPEIKDYQRVTEFGGGVAISVMDSASVGDCELISKIINVADTNKIKWQYKASTRGGNDVGAISISGGGIKTASISVPCKYIHSSVSCMNKNDYLSCKELIEKIIENAEEI